MRMRHWAVAALVASLGAAACSPAPSTVAPTGIKRAKHTGKRPAPGQAAGAPLLAPAPAPARAFIEVAADSQLTGTVALLGLDGVPYFADNAAYRVAAVEATRALVTLSTLEEAVFMQDGQAITATTGAGGAFSVKAPAATTLVVNVDLAGGHRLCAIVPADHDASTPVAVDEATTIVAELLRYQLRHERPAASDPLPDNAVLTEVASADLRAMVEAARLLVPGVDFGLVESDRPSLAALKRGAGNVLRSRVLEHMASHLTAQADTPAPGSASAAANTLADTLTRLLGHRPLALSRAAGNGVAGYNLRDGLPAAQVALGGPTDAVTDAAGHLYIAEEENSRIKLVPASAMAGKWNAAGQALLAGYAYTVAGVAKGAESVDEYNALYAEREAASALVATAALPVEGTTDVFKPARLALHGDDMYVSSNFGHRVFFIPGQDHAGLYGRAFKAGRLYTLAGRGMRTIGALRPGYASHDNGTPGDASDDYAYYPYGLGELMGHESNLKNPSAIAVDPADRTLFVLDAGYEAEVVPNDDPHLGNKLGSAATYYDDGAGNQVCEYHASVRVMFAAGANAGKIYSLPVMFPDESYWSYMADARDMVLKDYGGTPYLYITDTTYHNVFRINLHEHGSDLNAYLEAYRTGATTSVLHAEKVVGDFWGAQAGYGPAQFLADVFGLFNGMAQYDGADNPVALLNRPSALAFDSAGNLLIADDGSSRIRLVTPGADGIVDEADGKVYTLGGAFDSGFLGGDARLSLFPQTSSLRLDSRGDVLVTDRRENFVRRLVTRRGSLD